MRSGAWRDSLRERLHRWRYRHENRARLRDADVVVLSHTKSGRTWLRVMLSHLYHQRHGIPEDQLLVFDNFHRIAPQVPRIYWTRDIDLTGAYTAADAVRQLMSKPVVVLVRDPRDVAASFRVHLRRRATRRELLHKRIDDADLELPEPEFLANPRVGVPRIVATYERWRKALAALPRHLILRYEDMRDDPARELRRLAAFLGTEFSDDEIARAVAFGEFDSLARKEQSGFFASDRLRPTAAGDVASAKVRQGRVGGWAEALTAEQAAEIDQLVRGLHPSWGYGVSRGAPVRA
jgi:hypothetical protein